VAKTKLLHKIFLSSAIMVLALSSFPLHAAKIKCWKNSDGIRECGNVLPPEYAQKGHEEINNRGTRTKHHKRALNPEELAEQKRLADEKKAAQQALKEQKRKDRILLSTFANEDEIVMARNGKITSIRTEVRLTYKSLNKAKEHLNKLRKKAASSERSGKTIPEKLAKNIQQSQTQIAKLEKFITVKKRELNRINNQFEYDMVRFKELQQPTQIPTNSK